MFWTFSSTNRGSGQKNLRVKDFDISQSYFYPLRCDRGKGEGRNLKILSGSSSYVRRQDLNSKAKTNSYVNFENDDISDVCLV